MALLPALLPVPTGSSVGSKGQFPRQIALTPDSKPRRIVSICLPGDQYLLQLVSRERIVALSVFAADSDISAHWEAARGIPVTHGGAEELIRLKPDLVLVSENSTPLTTAILKRLGVRVLELHIPENFEELRDQLRVVGQSLGEGERTEEMVRSMDARLARLRARRPAAADRPTALFYFQDRFVPGAHTFANAILEEAGFRNLSSSFSLDLGISASEESVIMARPQYLIVTRFRESAPTATQLSETEPLFRKLGPQTKIIPVSFRQLAEPDLSNLDLAEQLQEHILQ